SDLDHAIVREGLQMIFSSHPDLTVISTAGDGREAIARSEALRPDVIVMDIAMPGLNGIEATLAICKRLPSVRVIMLSMYHTSEHVFRAIQAGARGYILKESAGAELVTAVRMVMAGKRYYGNGVERPVGSDIDSALSNRATPLESLSSREREVLQFVVEGKTSAEIAGVLSLSPKSVETYRSRLMKKLGIENTASLVKFAVQHGVTSLK
nr:response regulator transcription factor [Nitrospiraceae bacterium]